MSILQRLSLLIFLPITIGTGIYALARPEGTVLNVVFRHRYIHLPNWISCNLPDGLWLFALLNTYQVIWDKSSFFPKLFWSTGTTALAIATEYLQAFHFIRGTFDLMDILSYEVAFLASTCIFLTTNLKSIIQT